MTKISQKENYNSEFGYCVRSSSIFFIPGKQIKTTISLSNYWNFKNKINVFIICNWRDLKGNLVKRENIKFDEGNVKNIVANDQFEGSCELEAYASTNLRIPYSAIMVIYECEESISMVHSYSRVYSNLEVEDKKTITDGHESCWTLKDNNEIYSYAVIHNGFTYHESQNIELKITNHLSQTKSVNFYCEELKPYETKIIKPSDHFPELVDFLAGKEGSCSIHFSLSESFTRALLCWETYDKTQLQVTHSNFDYSTHETDFIDSEYRNAHMIIPQIENKEITTFIYKDRAPGDYLLNSDFIKDCLLPNNLFKLNIENQELIFSRKDGCLPSRIVTGIQVLSPNNNKNLACECSLGVIHKQRSKKHFHWGVWSKKYNSNLIITSLKSIYGDPLDAELILRLYFAKSKELVEIILNWTEISNNNLTANINLNDYVNIKQVENNFMYISFYSEYGGFFAYTTMQKLNSFTIEHMF